MFSLLSATSCSLTYCKLHLYVEAEGFLRAAEALTPLCFFFLCLQHQAAVSYYEPCLDCLQRREAPFSILVAFCVKFQENKRTFPIQQYFLVELEPPTSVISNITLV